MGEFRKLKAALRNYLEARDRQSAAVMADRSQAEEEATLDVEMYEKRLRAFYPDLLHALLHPEDK